MTFDTGYVSIWLPAMVFTHLALPWGGRPDVRERGEYLVPPQAGDLTFIVQPLSCLKRHYRHLWSARTAAKGISTHETQSPLAGGRAVREINLELYARDAYKAVERGDVVVVIDVLRCSSTIITALVNGASELIPVPTVKAARALKDAHGDLVLAGERRGVKPNGFSLGNSPREFTVDAVAGRRIVITTTSGTNALVRSQGASAVVIGAFLNVNAAGNAVVDLAGEQKRGVSLVLSGKRGQFSLEDFLCAGAFVETLRRGESWRADAAQAAYLAYRQSKDALYEVISRGNHAQYLSSIGLKDDVAYCCQRNAFSIVPRLVAGRIVA
jgi:2-phosphosulfolactate phosphatase